jgi:CMP-N-acetylneuraminic acid synthetase/GT2 family glycosyltransferase
MTTPVSIIITAHNYAKYLPRALESALGQVYEPLDVVVVDDGSQDNTQELLARYISDKRLKTIRLDGVGLAAASNAGIKASQGQYIVRLDADDWFDENLCLVLATSLDKQPNVGMVFCDYHTVDVHGELIQTISRAKTNDEVELLDRPCLAAGAMYRRECYAAIGGYNEDLDYQEDYDFWIKFIERFEVRNISLPLMYYRQHGSSMSRNWEARMRARRDVKRKFVEEHRADLGKLILGVIPARADRMDGKKFPLLPFGDQSLLQRCIQKLSGIDAVDRVVVSTEDPEIAQSAVKVGADVPFLRSRATLSSSLGFGAALKDLLAFLGNEQDYRPDVVLIAYPHSPFIQSDHLAEAIDTLSLYRTDSVIGVVEDLTYHWKIDRHGLAPVGYQKRVVRQDKELVFKEAGGLYVVRPHDFGGDDDVLGKRIGHIELSQGEAFRISDPWSYRTAQAILEFSGREA